MKNRLFLYGVFCVFFYSLFIINPAQSEEENAIMRSIQEREKIMDTPMKISWNEKITHFYPDYPVINSLPDGKVELETTNIFVMTNEGKKTSRMTADFSSEYNTPYNVTNKKCILYWCKGFRRYEEYFNGEKYPFYIESYDGEKSRFFVKRTTSSGKSILYGKIIDGFKQNTLFFHPGELWCSKAPTIIPSLEKIDENTLKISFSSDNNTFSDTNISTSDHYMAKRKYFKGQITEEEINVLETKPFKDLILPSEVEKKKFKNKEYVLHPDMFFNYTEIEYTPISKEEILTLCQFKFPEGTKIGEFPGFLK